MSIRIWTLVQILTSRFLANFIDGTVEGTNNSVTDVNDTHDHSYYGNGCRSGQDVGSTTSCDSRIIEDGDNENQKIGAYYNFQASTSGTGGSMSANNANSPDTFCPLGWQLPYSGTDGDYYDKSRSWNYLLAKYNITNGSAEVAKIRKRPLSYTYAGNYQWQNGRLYNYRISTAHWSITNIAKTSSYAFNTWSTTVMTAANDGKAYGFTIRCDFGISILDSFPWHPRSLISIMAFHFFKSAFPLCQNYE